MTVGDTQFLKAMGIDPHSLGEPVPSPLPSTPRSEPPIPKLAEDDSLWLQNLGVVWDEPEPDIVPPRTLPEFLVRYPTKIRESVEAVADELGLAMSDNGLDDLAQRITQMFLDFVALDLEDVVALYEFHRSLRPGGFSFPDYIRFRVKVCIETVLKLDPPRGSS